ncbi:MAG: tripartite tricarboxylate transporter substrate binding protein [Firmicutes bacterium]|nr:tripartite tricarboxylate transporter substrate binding protein [Bacillota bacterium]
MKRKVLAIMLIVAMIFVLAACGGKDSGGGTEPEPADQGDSGEVAPPDGWPSKPITIICPYSAGGGSDLMSRAVGEVLAERLGVSVVVDDKPGASGAVGMAALAAAKPDGYTLILTAMGACTLSPWTSDVGYTDEDFAPICQVSASPTFITVKADGPYKTFDDLINAAKANPGSITYGTSGAGGAHHVAVSALGLEIADDSNLLNHIAYDGGAAACTALLGGHIDAVASIYAEPSAYYESGDFVPVVVLANERQDINPDVPAITEFGYKTNGGTWYAFAAPAGTDEAILKYLEYTILDIMQTPEMQETFKNLGNPVVLDSMEGITARWKADYQSNHDVLKAIGMID